MPIPARPEVAAIPPYVPGLSPGEVMRELGIADVVKLASNENPLGPSPLAVAAAARAAAQGHLYPEGTAPSLRRALAAAWGLEPDWFIVGNGSDEVFRLLAEAYLRPGDRVVVPTPGFAAYTIVARLMGAAVEPVPLDPAGAMDLAAMAAVAAGTGDRPPARLVFLTRPNNPTGGVFSAEAFARFLAAVPPETLVVLDEAYREYDSTPFDTRGFVLAHPHLVVTRTFSKVYGLAGFRVGYGVGRPEVLAPLFAIRDPFSVSLIAQAAAEAALADAEHLRRSVALAREGREFLYGLCRELGLRHWPSEANFVLIDLGRPAAPVHEALLRRGVIVRPAASFGLPTCIRVTVGTPEQNQRFAAALRAVLG
ncbi:MAG: histidinol-phosphate transaminase [Bacillota bacterium]